MLCQPTRWYVLHAILTLGKLGVLVAAGRVRRARELKRTQGFGRRLRLTESAYFCLSRARGTLPSTVYLVPAPAEVSLFLAAWPCLRIGVHCSCCCRECVLVIDAAVSVPAPHELVRRAEASTH